MPNKYDKIHRFEERMQHLDTMEDYVAYSYSPTLKSGVTIGYGIDLLGVNTVDDLVAHGIPKSTATEWEKLGIFNKTQEELVKAGIIKVEKNKQGIMGVTVKQSDGTFKALSIEDNDDVKRAMAANIFTKVDNEIGGKYIGKIPDEVYDIATTLYHFEGGTGTSGSTDHKDPFKRKSAAVFNFFDTLDKGLENNVTDLTLINNVTTSLNSDSTALKSAGSPANSNTLLRELNYLNKSVSADALALDENKNTVIEAQKLLNQWDATYPDGALGIRPTMGSGPLSNVSEGAMISYPKIAKGMDPNDRASLNENIFEGTKAWWDEYGATGTDAFWQNDDKNRRHYIDFMKDNGYLSYTDKDGNVINYADQDLTTAEGAVNARTIIASFVNETGSGSYGEKVSGQKDFWAFDSNLENMFGDALYNSFSVANHLGHEKVIMDSLRARMNENDILKDYTSLGASRRSIDSIDLRTGRPSGTLGAGAIYAFPKVLEKDIGAYIADNNIDLRTSANQTTQDAIGLLLDDANIDPNAGVSDDPDYRPLENLDDAALQAELDSLTSEYGSATAERKIEIDTMLGDVQKEQGIRQEAAIAKKAEDDQFMLEVENEQMDLDPDYIRGVQDGTIQVMDANMYEKIMLMNPDKVQANIEGITEDQVVENRTQEEAELGAPRPRTKLGELLQKAKNSKVLGMVGEGVDALSKMIGKEGGIGLLQYAVGKKSMDKALEDIPIEEGHKLDGAWHGYMNQMKELSSRGLSAEERFAAQNDLSEAYNLGVKNVARASGGSRATFLAGAGVLNANRVKGLLKLNAMDQATHRQNLQNYGKAVQYQQTHDQREGEIDKRMAYNEAKRKSDIHGTIGATLIGEAIKNVSYAINSNSNAGYMNEFMKNLDLDYWNKNQKAELQTDLGNNLVTNPPQEQ